MQMNFPSDVLACDVTPAVTFDLFYQDLGLILDAAVGLRISLPVSARAQTILGSTRGNDHATKGFSTLADYTAELTKIAPPPEHQRMGISGGDRNDPDKSGLSAGWKIH